MGSVFQFDAFISYNRRDIAFADALERALEHYLIPRSVRPDGRRLRVFRDTQDMTGTDYEKAIRRHLDASAKLLLICSPNSRQSAFVDEEVAYFIEGHSPESVIPILIDGLANNEPGDPSQHAFPPALVAAMGMPLALDYRAYAGGSLRKAPFSDQWFGMLADLLGVSREQIEERDRKYRASRLRLFGGIGTLVGVTTLALSWAWYVERVERAATQRMNDAQIRLQLALAERDAHARAEALAELIDEPKVAGTLAAAVETSLALYEPQVTGHSYDYANRYWSERSTRSTTVSVAPLAATSLMAQCEGRGPDTAMVSAERSADGLTDIYTHGEQVFIQRADGLGVALAYCLRHRASGGLAFGNATRGPVAMAYETPGFLSQISPLRPGHRVLAIANAGDARFVDQYRIQWNTDGASYEAALARDLPPPPQQPALECFEDLVDSQPLATLLGAHGAVMQGDDSEELHSYLRGCRIDDGRVLAFVTDWGDDAGRAVVGAIDLASGRMLFRRYTGDHTCTAFTPHLLSYCELGDPSGLNVTAEVGVVHVREGVAQVHAVQEAVWSRQLFADVDVSPDGGAVVMWGHTGDDDPVSRPALIAFDERPTPLLLSQSISPIEQVIFSADGTYLLLRRRSGDLKLLSFDSDALLQELAWRTSPEP